MEQISMPRLVIAGLSGGAGKTIVSMAMLLLLRRAGVQVRAFKKGPDYIDAAWLQWGSGYAARNLDTWMMGSDSARSSFVRHGIANGVNVIEGNRGLFDGVDAAGTHSTAALARLLDAPVVLVVDATKMTRTAAALVLGCKALDPQLNIAAVVLNNVNGHRHEKLLCQAIQAACGVPVVGALPRAAQNPLPERHLGLVSPDEHDGVSKMEQHLLDLASGRLDLEALLGIARSAPPLAAAKERCNDLPGGRGLRIGYIRDAAFSFYYPENLEALASSGAELVALSALESLKLPADLHALYIGGGFPETHAKALAANRSLLGALHQACTEGLPVYAECGGLMLLACSVSWQGSSFPMAGVLPVDIEVCDKPQGHGYAELRVDRPNPFFPPGILLRGHEFHYSHMRSCDLPAACAVLRGTGCFAGRDGLLTHNVLAAYTHLHAGATPEWARGMIAAARHFLHSQRT